MSVCVLIHLHVYIPCVTKHNAFFHSNSLEIFGLQLYEILGISEIHVKTNLSQKK